MGFLSDLAGGLLGDALGGIVNGGVNSSFAQHQAEMQAKLQRENWEYAQKNSHQFEVQDLRAAGLNPVLSATNSQALGMPGAPSGSIDIKSTVNSAVAAKRQYEVAKINADTENKNAETRRLEQETNKQNADNNQRLIDALIPMHNATTGKINAETGKISAETSKVMQDISNSIKLTDAQVEQLRSGTALNYEQINYYKAKAVEAIAHSDLSNAQKRDLEQRIGEVFKNLYFKDAQYQLDMLTNPVGYYSRLGGDLGHNLFRGLPYSGLGR